MLGHRFWSELAFSHLLRAGFGVLALWYDIDEFHEIPQLWTDGMGRHIEDW